MINMIRTVKYISTRHKRKLDTLVEELVERVEKETDEDKEEIIHAVAVLGWLVKEIQKELEGHRVKEEKIYDNELAHDLIIILKDKEGIQTLELKPRHGSRVKWKREKEAPSTLT